VRIQNARRLAAASSSKNAELFLRQIVTNQVMRLQLTAGAARRIQTPVPLWCAVIRLDSTASDF